MIIKILGTGCAKCKALQTSVELAIKELGLNATIEKVEDINEIMQYDIMATPGLVIDEKIVMTGRVPSVEELIKMLPNLADHKKDQPDCKSGGGRCCCGGGDC